jgi:energy-coupling factor transporter ATP-binding protein EcfA2
MSDPKLHVTHVRSNLKSGVNTPLGYRTLIVGPNGSGKSAIQNTVELVLMRRVSDVAGRTDAADMGIVGLMAPDGASLTARVELSDASIIDFEASRNGSGGWSRPVVTGDRIPAVSFPVQVVRENLTGSPEKARKFLLAHVGDRVSREEVLRYLPNELHPTYNAMANGKPGTEVERLVAVLEAAKARVRTAKQEADAAEATKARMSADLAPEPSDAALADADAEVDRLRGVATRPVVTVQADYDTPIAEVIAAVQRDAVALRAAQAEFDAAAALFADTPTPPASTNPILPHLHKVANAAAELPMCIVCGTPWNDDMRAEASDVVASIEGIADLMETYAARAAEVERLRTAVRNLTQRVEEGLASLEALEAEKAAAPVMADAHAVDPNAYTAARDRADALRRTKSAWLSTRGLRETVWNLQKEGKEAKEMFEACSGAVKDLLDLALGKFNTRVQSFLPEGDVFFLKVRDGDREVCQYGLYRDGRHCAALSGAEWARVTLALGCAVANDAEITVFTPEERAFDPNTLRSVMVALSDAPGQVILTSPIKPNGRIPKGWTIIDRTPNTPTETA